MEFDPFVLVLPQDIYTYLLRVIDLNMNFADPYQKEFFMINNIEMEEYYKLL